MYRDLGPLAFFTGTTFILIVVVYLLAFAIFSSWLASEKGRSVGSWFVLGLLFGPVALFAVGIAPDPDVNAVLKNIDKNLFYLKDLQNTIENEKKQKAKREEAEAKEKQEAAAKAERASRIKTKEDLLNDPETKAAAAEMLRMYGESAQESYLNNKMKELGITEEGVGGVY